MVRKSTRSAALKASEKVRRESPRNRRRKSHSSEESDEEVSKTKNLSANRSEKGSSGNESDTESKKPLKKRTRSMAVNEVNKSNFENESHSMKSNKDQQDDEGEVNEENISKGKSKSINKSNNDYVNPETENENMQVTDESPKDAKDDNPPNNGELSKNGMESSEIDVNISQSIVAEMTCDNQSSEITTEQTTEIVISEHVKSVDSNLDENSSDLTQTSLETVDQQITEEAGKVDSPQKRSNAPKRESKESKSTEKLKELDNESTTHHLGKENTDSSKKIKLNRLPRDRKASVEVQTEKEEKKEEEHEGKKKLTLKRPENKSSSLDETSQQDGTQDSSPKDNIEGDNWGSIYEASNTEDKNEKTAPPGERPTRKKITLKRSTVDDTSGNNSKESTTLGRSTSLQEKIERRKSSSSDIIIETKRRSSVGVEKSTSESEEKYPVIKKPTKVVKLIRKLLDEPQEPPPPGEESIKKYRWGHSEVSNDLPEILTLENLREVCADIQLLNENEVDLELVIREHKSPEKMKRKTFKELEEEEMENIQAELNAEQEDVEVKENIIAMNRKISIVEDTASKLKPPPSPAKNPISEVLFITNLVRPFTIKQLKELLERTGKIREDGFWTDRIKSKCYVYYETAEEAESTRNALHGVHWPIGNGKQLIIDYATVEDMENAKNPPILLPKKEKSPEKENKKPDIQELTEERGEMKTVNREWDLGKDDHRRRRSRSRSRERRERKHSRRSYTPEDHHSKKRKHEEPVPQKAMDDLFLKTKATPSIYWQPLSPEEIARKQQQRQARLEENKRRLEEIRSSGRGAIRDRSGRDRNFRRR